MRNLQKSVEKCDNEFRIITKRIGKRVALKLGAIVCVISIMAHSQNVLWLFVAVVVIAGLMEEKWETLGLHRFFRLLSHETFKLTSHKDETRHWIR